MEYNLSIKILKGGIMAESMTGYGRGEYLDEKYHFIIETKSVNNRYLDINIRLPRKINYLEDFIRKTIKQYISRGKIEMFIKLELNNESDVKITYDKNIAADYISILNEIGSQFNLINNTSSVDIAKFQDVIRFDEAQLDDDEVRNALYNALKESLSKLKEMRKKEGNELQADILCRCDLLSDAIAKIESLSDGIENEYRERLTLKLTDILDRLGKDVDEQRIVQEAAIFAERSNIDEEITRFKTHINQLKTIVGGDIVGRKIDFIIQEMNREINTIGSKTATIEVTNIVVDVKSELEKIREQIQNIE